MSDVDKFRMRFRFWTLTPLTINEPEYRFMVRDREVVLSGPDPDVPIRQSQWHIMNARGFDSEIEAREFGLKLKAAAEISAVATRMGIDTGRDLATTRLSNEIRNSILEQTGNFVRDNVHGIDVFPDMPNVRIITVKGTGIVSQGPEPFLGDLTGLLDCASQASQQTRNLVLLLSYALKRSEPVAQIVFAISAVEMLGQQEKWSKEQEQILELAATNVEAMQIGITDERAEVASAIRRGTHKIGLRQGVMRLLDSLGLGYLKKSWDEIYGHRSSLVHGLAPEPGADYNELAFKSVSLCGQILLKAIAREVSLADRHVDRFYVLKR